jgi:transposase
MIYPPHATDRRTVEARGTISNRTEEMETGGPGRPPLPSRSVVEGILWVMRTGAPWRDMPRRYPSSSTCFRRLRCRALRARSTLARAASRLAERGALVAVEAVGSKSSAISVCRA